METVQHSQAHIATPSALCDDAWYLDSGATHHTTPISESLESKSEYHVSSKLLVGNGSALPITHVGQLHISDSKPLHLRNILLVPSIKKNLISISQFTLHNDVTVEFDASCCYVKDKQTKTILVQGKLNNGLYQLDVPTSVTMQPAATASSSSLTSVSHVFTTSASDTSLRVTASSDTALHSCSRNQPNVSLWHNRLGHPHHLVLKQVLQRINVPLMSSSQNSELFCEPCQLGKLHQFSYPSVPLKTTKPLQIVHSDVWGPAPYTSSDGYQYYISFVDDFTRFVWIYPLKLKSETTNTVLQFVKMAARQLDTKLHCLQTDFGGEYRRIIPLLQSSSIIIRHPCPYNNKGKQRENIVI